MLELLSDCHEIHLSCTQIRSTHHVYIRNIYLMICISDLNAVSTKTRQDVARIWIFSLCLTAWLLVFCRLAERCSLSYGDCCDWRYFPYLCRPLLNIWGFVCEYTHTCTYAYGYKHASVHECRPTYACVYELVCARVTIVYVSWVAVVPVKMHTRVYVYVYVYVISYQ